MREQEEKRYYKAPPGWKSMSTGGGGGVDGCLACPKRDVVQIVSYKPSLALLFLTMFCGPKNPWTDVGKVKESVGKRKRLEVGETRTEKK